jgi:4-amino-4-deoxychorismate lyase
MSLLFETVRIENGAPRNPEWHEKRMERARKEVWNLDAPVCLEKMLRIPGEFLSGTARCRILYGPDVQRITYSEYERKRIRSLKLVTCDTIDYHLKFYDRRRLDQLQELRGTCDEILIVKNGYITDTSLSNIIFKKGEKWVTPANPLLRGTCRERLIAEGSLLECDIRPEDLAGFDGFKIINALRDPVEELTIPVSQIFR